MFIFQQAMETVMVQYSALLSSEYDGLPLKQVETQLPGSATTDSLVVVYQAFCEATSFPSDIDFLVDGKLLRDELHVHFEVYNINTEIPVSVVMIQKTDAPAQKPEVSVDDWITAIASYRSCIYFGCFDNSVYRQSNGSTNIFIKAKFPVLSVDCAGSLLAVASRASDVEVYEMPSQNPNKGELKFTLKGHNGPVKSVSFDETVLRLASLGEDGLVKIWSTMEQSQELEGYPSDAKKSKMQLNEMRSPLVTLSAHSQSGSRCLWCKGTFSNELITCGFDNTLKVYDLDSLKVRASYTRDRPYSAMDRSLKCHLIASACFDTKVRIYDVREGNEVVMLQSADAHDQLVSCVGWSPDRSHEFISGSYEGLVKLWDLRSPKVSLYDIKTSTGKVLDCLWSNDGNIYFGGEDCTLFCFSTA